MLFYEQVNRVTTTNEPLQTVAAEPQISTVDEKLDVLLSRVGFQGIPSSIKEAVSHAIKCEPLLTLHS